MINSLQMIETHDEVEIIPQTMPPFPWHFGGQRYHNLFVDGAFIQEFCKVTGMRICLDASHSKLACNHLKASFSKFLQDILPFTAHLHLADAKDVDGEGLQIHDGEIDWLQLFTLMDKLAPKASFIPEIWWDTKIMGKAPGWPLSTLRAVSGRTQIRKLRNSGKTKP